MRSRRAAVLPLLAALAVGCGTTGDDSPEEAADEARSTPEAAEAEQPLSPVQERGRELFVESCGSCHTLGAAGTQGSIGPNLDEAHLDEEQVLAAIADGPGAMPENLVSGEDAQAVASFVGESGPGP